jgi:chromosome partitioning protein
MVNQITKVRWKNMTHKKIVVANQKGGVGKTTVAVHLACLAHEIGLDVLLVDLDQQGSASFLCSGDGRSHETDRKTVLDLWYPDRDLTFHTSVYGFDFLKASNQLDSVDDDLDAAVQSLHRLDDYRYDMIIFDAPPAPGVRQLAPLLIADRHIVPVTADALGTQGLLAVVGRHHNTVLPVNPALDLRILVNLHKTTSATQKAVIDKMRGLLGSRLVDEVLTDREVVKHALRAGKPVWGFSKDAFFTDTWRVSCEELL